MSCVFCLLSAAQRTPRNLPQMLKVINKVLGKTNKQTNKLFHMHLAKSAFKQSYCIHVQMNCVCKQSWLVCVCVSIYLVAHSMFDHMPLLSSLQLYPPDAPQPRLVPSPCLAGLSAALPSLCVRPNLERRIQLVSNLLTVSCNGSACACNSGRRTEASCSYCFLWDCFYSVENPQ